MAAEKGQGAGRDAHQRRLSPEEPHSGCDAGWALAGFSFRRYIGFMRKLLMIVCFALLAGCVGTAKTIITAPVRVVGKGVDWTTTSQDEADRNRGRELRKQEERDRKERKRAEKEARRR